VIGALSAMTAPAAPPDELPVSAIQGRTLEPRRSASGLYWGMVCIMAGLAAAYLGVIEHHETEPGDVALLIALTLPGIQLGASALASVVIWRSKRVDKQIRLRHLGKITLRSFLGALIGVALMLPLLARC
jgi:hypothetical protein